MASQSVPRPGRKVILVADRETVEPTLLAALRESAEVEIVPTLEAARATDAAAAIVAITSGADGALPRGWTADLPAPHVIIEHLGQGVGLFDAAGRPAWSNSPFRALAPDVISAAEALVRISVAAPAEGGPAPAAGSMVVGRRTVTIGRDQCFDLTASALRDAEGRLLCVVVFVSDTSATRRLQERFQAIDAAGRELLELDPEAVAKMDVGERLRVLEEQILRYSHELLHFDHLIVRVLDPKTRRLDTVFAGGVSERAKSLEIFASPEGNGITGYVAATGVSYICPDVTKDTRFLPGLEGARSTLTVPILFHRQVVGTLNIESEQVNAFTEEDRQSAETLGRYIALSLHLLRLLAVERHAAGGQVAADVHAETADPLTRIAQEASTMLSQAGVGPEATRRLRAILEQVERVRKAVEAVAEGQVLEGITPAAGEIDPVLSGKRVLVAEDEDIIRETVADVLTRKGAQVVTARDGAEAIEILQKEPFDLLLSDIKMPRRTGYDVFAAARERSAGLPVILITGFGYDPAHSIVRASREGLSGVLFKPFKVDQLLAEVRRALGAPA